MSEKRYSTQELISKAANARREAYALGPEETLAINRKLRAADALKEAARGLVSSSTPELYDEYYSATKKAIAAYEEI